MTFLAQSVKPRLVQAPVLTAQRLLSLQIVQMGVPELEQFINTALEQNPLLERADSIAVPESHITSNMNANSDAEDMSLLICAPRTLRDHVQEQIIFTFHDETERRIARLFGDYLDEAGYFCADTHELARNLSLEVANLENILHRLQQFDPAGIFARNLAECLALQLKRKGKFDPLMATMLAHLPLVAQRHFVALKRLCHVDEKEIVAAFAEIRQLDPKPGLEFSHNASSYNASAAIVPDVLIREQGDGSFEVRLNEALLPRLLFNKTYAQIIGLPSEQQDFLKNCTRQAHWLLQALGQRARSLLQLVSSLAEFQQDFLRHGIKALKPLTLSMLAEKLNLHVSTISRIAANKYVATPRGTFELRHFFSNSIMPAKNALEHFPKSVKRFSDKKCGKNKELERSTEPSEVKIALEAQNTTQHAAKAVKAHIKQMIAQERSDSILSDDALVSLLKNQDIHLSRRTVAKYREAMNIPSSIIRRREKNSLHIEPQM